MAIRDRKALQKSARTVSVVSRRIMPRFLLDSFSYFGLRTLLTHVIYIKRISDGSSVAVGVMERLHGDMIIVRSCTP